MTCPPCNHNCDQGRTCPARKKTMPAPTDLAAALLKDVPIRGRLSADETGLHEFVFKRDVLAALSAHLDALSAHLDAAAAERAGAVLEGVTALADGRYGGDKSHLTIRDADTLTKTADLITDLLTQNAALRAERDGFKQWSENWRYSAQRCLALAEKQEARLTAAEAEVEKLREELELRDRKDAITDDEIALKDDLIAELQGELMRARAALTTEAAHVNEMPKSEHVAGNVLTDATLIARLREIQGQAGLFASAAADRIEALVTKEKEERHDRT